MTGADADAATGTDAITTDTPTGSDATNDSPPVDAPPPRAMCDPGTRTGASTGATGLATIGGARFLVRVPAGMYDATVGSPLVVMYAPAVATGPQTESFTGFTAPARARGYLVAYVDHISPASDAAIARAGEVPDAVAAQWCIDPARVYLTGHSDGGSLSTLIAMRQLARVAAIAPSAAGLSDQNTARIMCRDPLAVMVMHSSGDMLFPLTRGFGAPVAQWWAQCAMCGTTPGGPESDGCVVYPTCAAGSEVRYCQGSSAHGVWPRLNESILDFFDRFVAR